MRLSRVVISNFRALKFVDVPISEQATCLVGENNTGKSCFIHALRVCLDVTLSSTFRSLTKEDIHCEVDRGSPFQVLIGVEFTGFKGRENEEALLHGAQISDDRARIFFRFRPKKIVREAIEAGEKDSLTLESYSWEISGGGNPKIDLTKIQWNMDNDHIGSQPMGLQYLQSYQVFFLPALRDVESDLQQQSRSPLSRLIEASNIDEKERELLIQVVQGANDQIEKSPTIRTIAKSIDGALKAITGAAFEMGVDLGLSDPSFQAIIRTIRILLSNNSMSSFDPRKNGLGMNNILYISILIEYFRKRAAVGRSAGELILIEEPEAHLHPQLQITLFESLKNLPFQSIVTTHSTQVTSKASLDSFVLMTSDGKNSSHACVLSRSEQLKKEDVADLERYLDATKSNLLFAKKVMLVEGPAELFLIPPLVEKVMGINLEREGISIIAIHGNHFAPFAKLFSKECMPKRCAIVADADMEDGESGDDEDSPEKLEFKELESEFVKVFLGRTTFEREITVDDNLEMLAATVADLAAPRVKSAIEDYALFGGELEDIKDKVLSTAKRFGKGRFSQVAARNVAKADKLPGYIQSAVEWLVSK